MTRARSSVSSRTSCLPIPTSTSWTSTTRPGQSARDGFPSCAGAPTVQRCSQLGRRRGPRDSGGWIRAGARRSTQARHRARSEHGTMRAFIAGFLSTLVFHQGLLTVLWWCGMLPRVPYDMTPVPPLGLPAGHLAGLLGRCVGRGHLAAAPTRGRPRVLAPCRTDRCRRAECRVPLRRAPLEGDAGGGWLGPSRDPRRADAQRRVGARGGVLHLAVANRCVRASWVALGGVRNCRTSAAPAYLPMGGALRTAIQSDPNGFKARSD